MKGALDLPVSAQRAANEVLILDADGHRVAHLLFASDLLRETRVGQAEEIVQRVNAFPLLVEAVADLIAMPQTPGSGAERLRRKDRALTLLRRLGEEDAVLSTSDQSSESPPDVETSPKGALHP